MELSIILFKQVIIMLIIILLGVICHKRKMISTVGKQELSVLLLMVVNPLTILMAYQIEFQAELLQNLLLSFVLAIGSYVIMIPISNMLIRKTGSRGIVERFSCLYQNCGYFGIPLISSVY